MKCWHMSGAGNDFMVIDARGLTLDFSALAKKLCAQVGADGFMALDTSKTADFKLHFYNSDGTRGEMCGNGSRCICRFAYDHGIAGPEMVIEADAGLVPGKRLSETQYQVQLNSPTVLEPERKPGVAYIELGNPGLPHAVTEIPDLTWESLEPLRQRAVALRHDPAFPKGANVNFYRLLGEGQARVLTFERGVEDYTLACGTGCGSVASTLWALGQLPGRVLDIEVRGGRLKVTVTGENGRVTSLLLEGPAEILKVYDIEIYNTMGHSAKECPMFIFAKDRK